MQKAPCSAPELGTDGGGGVPTTQTLWQASEQMPTAAPFRRLVGANRSQMRSASMMMWRLKAAPPPDLGGGKKVIL